MTDAAAEKESQLFKNYIAKKKILIADANASSRVGLARTLIDLGATQPNIVLVPNYETAVAEIEKQKPQVVVTDYDLGNRCGLELLQTQREAHPESRENLFVLVTGNTSQSAVAQAAEEDVDTYILKPYTIEVFRKSVMRAAVAKMYPDNYLKTIEIGKKLLAGGKCDEAMKAFETAMPMNPKPALACFYHGQAFLMKTALDSAAADFNQGLTYNKIHYKCMVGLFDVLMSKELHDEAYDLVKRMSLYFPANPKRLSTVLRLAIMTNNFSDIERYYQTFKTLDERNDTLVKYVCAALVICGKYYLQHKSPSRALELFEKAAVTAAGRTKILREIVVSLVEAALHKEAKEFLPNFPPQHQSEPDFLVSSYLVSDGFEATSRVIEDGRELIAKGVFDPFIYDVMIRRSVQAGLQEASESLVHDASVRWPDAKVRFQNGYAAAIAMFGSPAERYAKKS